MPARSALLYDTAASLRLLDTELRALDAAPPTADAPDADAPDADAPDADAPDADAPDAGPGAPGGVRARLRALLDAPDHEPVGLAALPLILERASVEVHAVLASLRESRLALETATVEKLQHTSAKLQEVTSATEVAATDILDALDRTQGMVDELEAADADGDRARARSLRERMREELFGMVGALQFQDITTQQLAHTAGVLSDMEGRLLQIARLFDPAAAARAAAGAPRAPDPRTYDPHATTRDPEGRQAVADAVFVGRGGLR